MLDTARSTSRLLDDLLDRRLVHQHVEHRPLEILGIDALAHGQVALRVEIDREHALAALGQRDAEVEGRGGLGHPALLVRERDHLTQRLSS